MVRAEDARGQRLTGLPVLCVEVLSDPTRGHEQVLRTDLGAGAVRLERPFPVTLDLP